MTDQTPTADSTTLGVEATAKELDDAIHSISVGAFADLNDKTVPAGWVRKLVISAGDGGAVWLRKARLDGLLDLRDARRRSGGPANALILEKCVLPGDLGKPESSPGVDASHAHMERLSLRDCIVSGVELSGAVIDGALELDGICGDRDPCWVKARGVQVGRSLSARKSKLRQPWPGTTKWPPDEPGWQDLTGPFALDLTGAEIGGSLTLWPEFEAIGGVSISGATIGEGLRALGARLDAADLGNSDAALLAQYARISGAVFLGIDDDKRPVRAQGPLNFYGAEIEGAVDLTGVEATASRDLAKSALFMPAVSVAGDALFYPGRLLSVELDNATFGARLDIYGSPIDKVSATACRVRGDLILGGTISKADFSGSVIEGRLALGEEKFRLHLRSINGGVALVSFTDARVGRELDVVPIETVTGHTVNADWARPPLRIRSHELTCYPGSGWHVAVALYPDSFGNGCALLNFLHRRNDAEVVEVVVLEGMSGSIHDLSDSLDIKKRPAAVEFLEFFCANVWGDEGPFLIEPGTVALTPGGVKGQWRAKAEVRYGTARFGAEFELKPDGTVTMLHDYPLKPVAQKPGDPLYLRPIRWFRDPTSQPAWPVGITVFEPEGDAWNDLDPRVEGNLVRALSNALDRTDFGVQTIEWSPPGQPRPTIDLGGLKVASLNDNDGRNWFDQEKPPQRGTRTTKLGLQLVGFEYDRIQQRPENLGLVALTAPSASSAEQGFESATQEGTATEGTEDEEVASESPPPETVGTATRGDSGRLLSSVFRPNTWSAALGRRFASLRERDQRTDAPEGANGSENGADLVRARLTWLESQYATWPPTSDHYQPEPYAQLARVLRLSGFFKQANDITYAKNKLPRAAAPRVSVPEVEKVLALVEETSEVACRRDGRECGREARTDMGAVRSLLPDRSLDSRLPAKRAQARDFGGAGHPCDERWCGRPGEHRSDQPAGERDRLWEPHQQVGLPDRRHDSVRQPGPGIALRLRS